MKPQLKHAVPEGVGKCEEEDCDHVVRYRVVRTLYCACHIPLNEVSVSKRMLTQAVNYTALEHPDFRVDPDGNISLEGE